MPHVANHGFSTPDGSFKKGFLWFIVCDELSDFELNSSETGLDVPAVPLRTIKTKWLEPAVCPSDQIDERPGDSNYCCYFYR
jgi:hypothetical protein